MQKVCIKEKLIIGVIATCTGSTWHYGSICCMILLP